MALTYEDFYETASGHFLTEVLETESTEWSDFAIQCFIEENITEAYQDWEWQDIYEEIDVMASANWYLYRKGVE